MNIFKVKCKGCNTLYNDIIEKGKSILLHKGLSSSKDDSLLPTPECIKVYDYVVFQECGHCSPEVFEECRACKLGYVGKLENPGYPTDEQCFCRYAIIKNDSSTSIINNKIKLVTEGKIEEALKSISNDLKDDLTETKIQIGVLLANFNRIERERGEGILSIKDYNIQRARIDKAVITLLETN